MAMVISIEIDGLPIGISLKMEVLLGKSSNYHLVMTNSSPWTDPPCY